MLFVIADSVAQALADQSSRGQALAALEELARAHRHGYHIVLAEPDTLSTIMVAEGVSESARVTYKVISGLLTELGAYLDKVSVRVEVAIFPTDSSDDHELANDGDCQVIRVSAAYLCRSGLTEQTVFLCEDLNDVRFFKQVAEVYQFVSGLGLVTLEYDPRSGGGSRTADTYREIAVAQHHLCLCIVDSDKTHPDGGNGGTARRISEFDRETPSPFCRLHTLGVRETENLIPPRMYPEAIFANPDYREQCRKAEFLVELAQISQEATRYVDIKRGMRLREITTPPENSTYRRYWEPLIRGTARRFMSIDDRCWTHPACDGTDECNCIVMEGLGDQVLVFAIESMSRLSPKKRAEYLSKTELRTDWEAIGKAMISWCCSLPEFGW